MLAGIVNGMTLDEALQIVAQQRAQIDELQRQLRAAQERIAQLEQISARQAAPFRRPDEKKISPSERKRPGRKPGHPGASRQRPAVIDDTIEVPLPGACEHCGGRFTDRSPLVQYIEEIPPTRPHVTKLTTWQAVCAECGKVHTTTHPRQVSRAQGAASVHLGPRAEALAALLNKHLGLTCGKTCEVLRQGFGLSISRGGLSQLLSRVAAKVGPRYEQLLEQVRGSPAVFADETSWWVGGPGWWLWVFTTPTTTVYRVADCRGSDVVRQTLGDDFRGMLVSDCLASYDPPRYRKHKCIAHHLRAIHQARDRPDTKDPSYLNRWKAFFTAVRFLYAIRPWLPEAEFFDRRAALERSCDELLAVPRTQAGDIAVASRLAKRREHLLGCLYEPAAEPTNNRAERALRPAVIARKVSCGNRTERGRQAFEILASLAATARQQARDFLAELTAALPLAMQAG
jgi:transposase